jgi:hypothetical protein
MLPGVQWWSGSAPPATRVPAARGQHGRPFRASTSRPTSRPSIRPTGARAAGRTPAARPCARGRRRGRGGGGSRRSRRRRWCAVRASTAVAMTTVSAVAVAKSAVVVTTLVPTRPSRGGLAVLNRQEVRLRRDRRLPRAIRRSGSLRQATREGRHHHTHHAQHEHARGQRSPGPRQVAVIDTGDPRLLLIADLADELGAVLLDVAVALGLRCARAAISDRRVGARWHPDQQFRGVINAFPTSVTRTPESSGTLTVRFFYPSVPVGLERSHTKSAEGDSGAGVRRYRCPPGEIGSGNVSGRDNPTVAGGPGFCSFNLNFFAQKVLWVSSSNRPVRGHDSGRDLSRPARSPLSTQSSPAPRGRQARPQTSILRCGPPAVERDLRELPQENWIGRRSRHGRASSNCAASFRMTASPLGGPTSWTPIGSSSELTPIGSVMLGWPVQP